MSVIRYGTDEAQVASRPSPIIWADCHPELFLIDPAKGVELFIDFVKEGLPAASTVAGYPFYSYIDSGGSFVMADDPKGALEFKTDGTDNDSDILTTGSNTSGLLLPVSASDKKWWFETRIKVNTITNGDIGLFVGLTQEGQAASGGVLTDNEHAMDDIDHIGFNVKQDDGNSIDWTFTLDGQADGGTVDIASLVVDTYIRLGFKYVPGDNKVHVFIDGVETKNSAVLASASNFPLDNLAVTLIMKAGDNAGSGDKMTVDWVRFATEY